MQRYAEPLFGMLFMLLMWWWLGDILDNFADPFLSIIAFAAASVVTVVWIYDLYETLSGGSDGRRGNSE